VRERWDEKRRGEVGGRDAGGGERGRGVARARRVGLRCLPHELTTDNPIDRPVPPARIAPPLAFLSSTFPPHLLAPGEHGDVHCADLLLFHMLRRLQHCVDVMAANHASGAGGSAATGHRARRGRERKLPFFYDPSIRTFRHR
jgi:hypothetical protein